MSSNIPLGIVVPVHRSRLTEDERFSFASIRHHLVGRPTFAIAPQGLDLPCEIKDAGWDVLRFPSHFFASRQGYNRLLLSSRFYRSFQSLEFVLIAQLDTLVFSDQAEFWCGRAWDYIGAPWGEAFSEQPERFDAVGNGGFSLRRVEAAMRVLSTPVPAQLDGSLGVPPSDGLWPVVPPALLAVNKLRRFLPKVSLESVLRRSYLGNEDVFWGLKARMFDPGFRVADVQEAMHFAFETNPAECFLSTGGQLPFGCHGWNRYGRSFWERHMDRAVPPNSNP